MAFLIDTIETPRFALSRIIAEQAGKLAVEEAEALADGTAFVHKARVRCKRIRASLGLALPLIGDKAHDKANRWWRDAGRVLSAVRDAAVQGQALEAERPHLEAVAGEAAVRALAARLRLQQRLGGAHRNEAAAIRTFLARIADRPDDPLESADQGDVDTLRDGLTLSYKTARKAMRHAFDHPTPEAFHDWRKAAKAHGLQLRLSRNVFPLVTERVAAVRELADCLGAIQDVEVLSQALAGEVGEGMDPRINEALAARRTQMEKAASHDGEALFGEKSKAWAARLLVRP